MEAQYPVCKELREKNITMQGNKKYNKLITKIK